MAGGPAAPAGYATPPAPAAAPAGRGMEEIGRAPGSGPPGRPPYPGCTIGRPPYGGPFGGGGSGRDWGAGRGPAAPADAGRSGGMAGGGAEAAWRGVPPCWTARRSSAISEAVL